MFPVKDNIATERIAVMTLLLIAVNVGVYIWKVNDALLPLATNILFLWVFGNSLEEAMGRMRFLAFYVLGGLVSAGMLVAADIEPIAVVAASGASAAVLSGYLVHYPHGRVLCVVLVPFAVTVVAVPGVAFLGVWAALQMLIAALDLNGSIPSDETVAYLAPGAGLVFGAIAAKLFAVRTSPNYLRA